MNDLRTQWTTWNNVQLIESGILEIGDGYRAKNSEMGLVGLPFARAGNIDNGFHFEDADLLDEMNVPKAGSKISRPGDVVFTSKGTVGRFAFVRPETKKFVYSPQLCYWRIKDSSIIDPRFLFYWMHGRDFTTQVHQVKGLTDMADYVSLGDQRRMKITAPPLPAQRKIASILSAYDDLSENNTRRIAILEEMAQSLYREWFVHFRFPGHEKKRLVESGLGLIPEGWEVVKLGDIADINVSNTQKGKEPAEINYVDIASVSIGHIDKVETIAFVDAPGRARRIVKHGDIIWSTVRPNRRSYSIILDPPMNMIVSTGFAVITANKTPYSYLYYALTTDDFVGYLTNHATGSAYPAVNSGDFQNALVLQPPSTLLDIFHNIIAKLLAQKQNLFRRNDNLRQTCDLLLPKLISGEVDVEGLNIHIEGGTYESHGNKLPEISSGDETVHYSDLSAHV
jgi:type I restriction enzyme S subunit